MLRGSWRQLWGSVLTPRVRQVAARSPVSRFKAWDQRREQLERFGSQFSAPGFVHSRQFSSDNSRRGGGSLYSIDAAQLAIRKTISENPWSGESPKKLLVFPLPNKPVYPHTAFGMVITDKNLCAYLMMNKVKYVACCMTKDTQNSRVGPLRTDIALKDMYKTGVMCEIVSPDWDTDADYSMGMSKDSIILHLVGRSRIRVGRAVEGEEFLTASARYIKDKEVDWNDPQIKAHTSEVLNTVQDMLKLGNHSDLEEHFMNSTDYKSPGKLADLAALLTTGDPEEQQKILEETDVEARLKLALSMLKKELTMWELQRDLQKQLEDKVVKNQRHYFLNEQLKNIKKELGMEKDEKETLIPRFQARLAKLNVPDKAKTVIYDEMGKLSTLEPSSSEFNVTRNYLDWLTQLPWGVYKDESLNIQAGSAVLEEDHFGLEDVKERIMELMAVGQLRGSLQGKIVLLVGPPGTGKTSIGRSIARALERDFVRFSVGGLTDVSEIKGHRRTYVGAMPGKVMQMLKRCASANPVLLIDEIDKLGRGYQGDPASALLEVLDPEQNTAFVDHYLDVPFDLSKTLFVCTANVTDTIPEPLLDRMEVIRLSGYVTDEKVEIAKRYLIPAAVMDSGLEGASVTITDDAIRDLVRWHCRESGVRSLQQLCEKTLRKAARKIVQELTEKNVVIDTKTDRSEFPGEHTPILIDQDNLEDYVGKKKFTSDRFYESTPPGVTMGLAWTAMGGATFYIETAIVGSGSDGGQLNTTGQMGNVMKESTDIAYSVAKKVFADKFGQEGTEDCMEGFEKNRIHIHIPEGATPKDGPSAGSAMTTALLSLATGKKVKDNLAMTGEITLTGKILPVGGIKEKIIAARRSGVDHVLMPDGNRKDYDELPEHLKEGLRLDFVSSYDEVFSVAFGS